MRNYGIIISLLFGLPLFVWSQGEREKYVKFNYYYGTLLPHHSSIEYIANSSVRGASLEYSIENDLSNYWDVIYRKPQIGVGYYFGSLGNDSIFSNAHALYSFFEAPFISNKRFRLDYSINLGMAYLPGVYDDEDNNLNIAIGSNLNVYLRFGLEATYRLLPKLHIFQGAFVSHISNGAVLEPNLGLNHVMLASGIRYQFHSETAMFEAEPEEYGKNHLDAALSFGIKQISNFSDEKFNVNSFTFSYLRNVSKKRSLGLGFDYFYDPSVPQVAYEFLMDEDDVDLEEFNRIGIHVRQDLQYKRVIMTLQLGIYVYNKNPKIDQPLYQRYGFKFLATENIYGIVALKSHYGKADFVEWGIGYLL